MSHRNLSWSRAIGLTLLAIRRDPGTIVWMIWGFLLDIAFLAGTISVLVYAFTR